MKTLWQAIGAIALAVAASDVPTVDWSFEDAQLGTLPKGWSAAKTGEGPGSVWKVIEDTSAPKGPKVLAQVSSEGPRPLFNLCVAEKASYADLDLSVAFKAVQGNIDQGGGPVWRYQDRNNYYIARMNPLEWNYRVYKAVNGKRVQLASADLKSDTHAGRKTTLTGKWHTIRIRPPRRPDPLLS